MEEIE